MAMGTMGGAGAGSESSKAMNLLELLADPVKSKAKLEDYDRRTKAAQDAEASSRAAKTEADQTIEHARQASEALRNQHADLDRRASEVSAREAAAKAREDAVTNAERAQVQAKQAWEQEQKRREDEYNQQVQRDVHAMTDLQSRHNADHEARSMQLDQREKDITERASTVQMLLADAQQKRDEAERVRTMHQAKLDELNKRIATFAKEVTA